MYIIYVYLYYIYYIHMEQDGAARFFQLFSENQVKGKTDKCNKFI